MNQKEFKAHFEAKYEVIGEYLEYVAIGMDDEDEMPDWVYDAIVDEMEVEDGFGYGFAETFPDRMGYGVGLLFVDDVPANHNDMEWL